MRFDFRFMEWAGYDMSLIPYYDVSVGVWLADTNVKMPSLKWAEKHFLGWNPDSFAETLGSSSNFYYLDPKDAYAYACTDAEGTFALAKVTLQYFKEAKLAGQLDNDFLYPLMKFEDRPLLIDIDYLEECLIIETEHLKDLELSIYKMIGYPIKLNSNKQLGDALQQMGINTGEYTKTGQMKVDIKTLESVNLESPHPILGMIIEFSRTFKLINSYISTLKEEAKAKPEGLRFSYLTNQVPTGRLACGSDKKNDYYAHINVQSVPKPHPVDWYVHEYSGEPLKKDDIVIMGHRFSLEDKSDYIIEGFNPKVNIRNAFKVQDDEYWVSCDYSGQELRVIANYTNEPAWVETFLTGGDLHKAMAINMWGEENYDKEKRKRAKVLNFGMAYGMSGFSLSKKFHVTVDEGNDIVNRFWRAAPNIQSFQTKCVRRAKKEGTVYNFFGRPRRVKYWFSSDDGKQRAFGSRTVNNTMIQSVGAELLKIAIIKLWKNLFNHPDWKDKARFLTTVHDECNFAIKKDCVVDAIKVIQSCMEFNIPGWKVPILIGIELGDRWGRTFAYEWDGDNLKPSCSFIGSKEEKDEDIDLEEFIDEL